MPQVWRSRPQVKGKGKGGRTAKDNSRAQALTKEIANLAREKQLKKAVELFKQFEQEGLEPSVYTFSSLINVHVRSGDLRGALRVLKSMRKKGVRPNVSIFTILLRGYSLAGQLDRAHGLLDEMVAEGISPDARAINTFFRGCLHRGHVPLAREVFEKMKSWQIVPDDTSLRLMAQLLSQGLCFKELKSLAKLPEAANSWEPAPAKQKKDAAQNDCQGLFKQLSFEEARRELQRIRCFAQQEDPPQLFDYLCRIFLFSQNSESQVEISQSCVNELVLRGSAADNGDWVIAQAKAEEGLANWIALELRHDRVHNIFSRMVFEQVSNLCVIRGDAAQVIPQHFQQESVSHVFVNFPEPPHFSGAVGHGGDIRGKSSFSSLLISPNRAVKMSQMSKMSSALALAAVSFVFLNASVSFLAPASPNPAPKSAPATAFHSEASEPWMASSTNAPVYGMALLATAAVGLMIHGRTPKVARKGTLHGIKFPYSIQKDSYADLEFQNDIGYLPDGTPMNRAGNCVNHPETIGPDPHSPGSALPRAEFCNSVGYLPDGTPMNRAGNAINHPETISPDMHAPGSPLPASHYYADVGYLVDGTDLLTAGNNSVRGGAVPPAAAPAASAAPAMAASGGFAAAAGGTLLHARGFLYSVQKDAYADLAFGNDIGYLPDGTAMNRAGNCINHPETIGPDPHSPGAPLPRALFVNDVGYLPDGTPLNRAGNCINHPETIGPDPHSPGSALPSSAYAADIGSETAESKNELLTATFFQQLHSRLAPAGRLTILSDNRRYIKRLANTIATLVDGSLFEPTHAKADFETLHGIPVSRGTPGKRVGHTKKTTSYFDRLWAKGDHKDPWKTQHGEDVSQILTLLASLNLRCDQVVFGAALGTHLGQTKQQRNFALVAAAGNGPQRNYGICDVVSQEREWHDALATLGMMRSAGLRSNLITESATVGACAKSLRWSRACGILHVMRQAQVQPNTIAYNSAITACGARSGSWFRAMQVFEQLRLLGLPAGNMSYNTVISALEYRQQWQRGLSFLEDRDVGHQGRTRRNQQQV
eukprot:g1408.t1